MAKTPHELTIDVNVEPALTALDKLRQGAQMTLVFGEVMEEIFSARAQHGDQNHLPLGFGDPHGLFADDLAVQTNGWEGLNGADNAYLETVAKRACETDPTWAMITFEEFAESMAAGNLDDTRDELVQLAAMAVCSILALDTQREAKIEARLDEIPAEAAE